MIHRERRHMIPGTVRTRIVAICILSLLMVLTMAMPSLAATEPIIGSPDQCTVEPRPEAFFAGYPATVEWALPQGDATPISSLSATPPAGAPAEPETEAAVIETLTELSACENAGDLQRVLALYTDDAARQRVELAGSETFLESQEERSEGMWRGFVLQDAIVLEHGAIGAIVETTGGRYSSGPDLRFFIELSHTDEGLRVNSTRLLGLATATPSPQFDD